MDNPEKQIPAVVEQKDGYIEITFSDQIPRGMIENQVRECQSGTCECCTPEFRSNVESFEIVSDDQTCQWDSLSSDSHWEGHPTLPRLLPFLRRQHSFVCLLR